MNQSLVTALSSSYAFAKQGPFDTPPLDQGQGQHGPRWLREQYFSGWLPISRWSELCQWSVGCFLEEIQQATFLKRRQKMHITDIISSYKVWKVCYEVQCLQRSFPFVFTKHHLNQTFKKTTVALWSRSQRVILLHHIESHFLISKHHR